MCRYSYHVELEIGLNIYNFIFRQTPNVVSVNLTVVATRVSALRTLLCHWATTASVIRVAGGTGVSIVSKSIANGE